MKRETYLEKIGQLSLEIREADRQIMGLVEEARNGTLYKEE